MKYTVRVSRRGPQSFRVLLGPSHVDVVARKLNDGGLIIQARTPARPPRRVTTWNHCLPGPASAHARPGCGCLTAAARARQVDGQSHVIHSEEEAVGTRLTIDSLTCLLAAEMDPSRLVAMSPGKIMRYLVPEGAHVVADQAYAEVEARARPSVLSPLAAASPVAPSGARRAVRLSGPPPARRS